MVTCVFTLEGRERGGLGPEAGEKVVPRKSIKRVSGETQVTLCRGGDALSVLVDVQLPKDGPLVLVAVA